jgi:ABC-type phosphate transport system substrate-binding protein
MQRLETLYNAAPGCDIEKGDVVNKGKCNDTGATPTGPTNGNYDHDLFVSATPTGSSAGVDALRGAPFNQYNPTIDYARSSSGGDANRLAQLTYWGYARDAIAVVTFGSAHTNLCVSQAELSAIWNLTITNWNQLHDCTGAAYPSAPIIPWSMNTSSGTYATFKAYIAPIDPASNGRKLAGTSVGPFENDIKPILADQGPTAGYGADDDETNAIWWMSYAAWLRYPYVKNGCQDGVGTYDVSSGVCTGGTLVQTNLAKIGSTPATSVLPSGASINNGSYPISRTIYHVTRNIDADCNGASGSTCGAGPEVVGTTSGKGGAVREFTEWLCRTSDAQQAKNPVTGNGYRTEIVGAINAEGFQQAPLTNGYRCTIQT